MTKVYIATEGCYSDYHIVTVFLNKKKAELFAEYFKDMEIEEFDVYDKTKIDELMRCLKLKRDIYFVRMDIDGKTDLVMKEDWGFYWFELTMRKKPDFNDWGLLCVYVLAENEKDAVKIVNERRVQLIANNEWIKQSK
jgi:hypothetical protein